MASRDRDRWNDKYAERGPLGVAQPDSWLTNALRLIEDDGGPESLGGRALDIACGLGHNAIWLAGQGWRTTAVDISAVGLRRARRAAAAGRVRVEWIEADLDDWAPSREYDLAAVFRFLDRESVPRLANQAIRLGGWLVYETFSSAQCLRADNHIHNSAYTLAPGELPTLFPKFDVVAFREEAMQDRTVQRFLGRRVAE